MIFYTLTVPLLRGTGAHCRIQDPPVQCSRKIQYSCQTSVRAHRLPPARNCARWLPPEEWGIWWYLSVLYRSVKNAGTSPRHFSLLSNCHFYFFPTEGHTVFVNSVLFSLHVAHKGPQSMIGITTLWIHFLTVIVDAKQTFCYNTHMGATKNGRRFVPRFRGHCDPLSIHMTLC